MATTLESERTSRRWAHCRGCVLVSGLFTVVEECRRLQRIRCCSTANWDPAHDSVLCTERKVRIIALQQAGLLSEVWVFSCIKISKHTGPGTKILVFVSICAAHFTHSALHS